MLLTHNCVYGSYLLYSVITRGTAKQQEFEERMLALMEELKANQAEQASCHEEILQELHGTTSPQVERLAKLTNDYEG